MEACCVFLVKVLDVFKSSGNMSRHQQANPMLFVWFSSAIAQSAEHTTVNR